MARVYLRLYVHPGMAEVFINFRLKDGGHRLVTATIDTGAEVSLLPFDLMPTLDIRLAERSEVVIEQAGIAGQAFKATEAFVSVFLEDQTGTRTREFEIRVWFANTSEVLLGFEGVLDQAILHLDFMGQRSGWIEITD